MEERLAKYEDLVGDLLGRSIPDREKRMEVERGSRDGGERTACQFGQHSCLCETGGSFALVRTFGEEETFNALSMAITQEEEADSTGAQCDPLRRRSKGQGSFDESQGFPFPPIYFVD